MPNKHMQLSKLINTKDHNAVINEAKRIYEYYYKDFDVIENVFNKVKDLFEGRFPGYQKCNTQYHDLQHTVDAFLAAVRIMDGYTMKQKMLPQHFVQALLIAALLHDVGYIQEEWDTEGTGAKYTSVHVQRSVEFVQKYYRTLGFESALVPVIQTCIQSTGLSVEFDKIPFSCKEQKIVSAMMGTADLLGQMSDREYLEKLLFLYYEFKEAGIPGYTTEFDIIKKTIDFYALTVKRLKSTLLNVQRYCLYHFENRFGIRCNLYMLAINRNIRYVKKIIADETTNFRHKLKRGNQCLLHQLSQRTLPH